MYSLACYQGTPAPYKRTDIYIIEAHTDENRTPIFARTNHALYVDPCYTHTAPKMRKKLRHIASIHTHENLGPSSKQNRHISYLSIGHCPTPEPEDLHYANYFSATSTGPYFTHMHNIYTYIYAYICIYDLYTCIYIDVYIYIYSHNSLVFPNTLPAKRL